MENTNEFFNGEAGFGAISDEDLQRLITVDHEENQDAYMSLYSPCYPQQDPNTYMPQSSPLYPQQNPDAFLLGIDGITLSPEAHPFENPGSLVGQNQLPDFLADANSQVESDPKSPENGWQRVKWTNAMVKLLITIVSYIGWDSSSSSSSSNEGTHLLTPVKGKWRVISNLMVERGFMASPHQCEDKFNDLCKKFKRLNEVLGRFNACTVAENPSLLEAMNVPNKAKAEVRKILGCKHLFFEEMCSYFDGNRTHLPHDEALQESVRAALKGKARYRYCKEFHDKYTQKGMRGREDHGDAMDIDQSSVMNGDLQSRLLQVKERRIQIERDMLELESRRFEWLRMSEEEDGEIHVMRLRNELMKLENERLRLETEARETGSGW